MSGVRHNSSRANERSGRFDNATLTPSLHVSFAEEKHQSLRSNNSPPQTKHSSLGRATSSLIRSRGLNLGRTFATSAKRVLKPLCRLSTMSFRSVDRISGGSKSVTSSHVPLLSEQSINNDESHSPTAPTLRARQSSSHSMQHDRISAHFDDTGKSDALVDA